VGWVGLPENERGLIENERGLIENERRLIENERGLIENERGLSENERGLSENEQGPVENERELIENERGLIENGRQVDGRALARWAGARAPRAAPKCRTGSGGAAGSPVGSAMEVGVGRCTTMVGGGEIGGVASDGGESGGEM
jgi:hypothetical protein